MISALLGSKNAERVLLFLLVNQEAYASQIQRAFQIPLTPLQSILEKFEKAKILSSQQRGKVKYFYFDTAYPLHKELKSFLKSAFVFLPQEEKELFFSKSKFENSKQKMACLHLFWQRLEQSKNVSIQTEADRRGQGNVTVLKKSPHELIFTERGAWIEGDLKEMDFTKTLRWSLDVPSGLISLEHLHYGQNQPVFLFHLEPVSSNALRSVESYQCGSDCYFGKMELTEKGIHFLWRILGPKKNEILSHFYT